MSLYDADKEFENFGKITNKGTPLYCMLHKYANHPDYISSITSKKKSNSGAATHTSSTTVLIDDD